MQDISPEPGRGLSQFQGEEVCKGQHRARCSQESLPPPPSFCRRVRQPGRDAMMNGLIPSWLSPALPLSPTTPTSPALGRDNRDQQGAKSVRSFHREEAAKLPQGGGRPWRETQEVAGQPPEQSRPGQGSPAGRPEPRVPHGSGNKTFKSSMRVLKGKAPSESCQGMAASQALRHHCKLALPPVAA